MATTTTKKATTAKAFNAGDIVEDDIFSEVSHYTFLGMDGKDLKFNHHASGTNVTLTADYVEKFLKTANQFTSEVEVGKEDKLWTLKRIEEATKANTLPKDVREGDVMVPGIRTLWENIHGAQVFTVCFQKQGSALSDKKLAELRNAQIDAGIDAIDKAVKGKTGVAKAAAEQMKKIQENPIIPFETGDMRELTGYKVQFHSRDGRYNCVDMKITTGMNIRPVNINTIEWLVYDGIKYIVK
jgi:hypothetical protein